MSRTNMNAPFARKSGQYNENRTRVATASPSAGPLWRLASTTFLLLFCVILLAACERREEKVLFGGKFFPASAKVDNRADRKTFVVSVRRADQDAKGALEAGRHEGTAFCLENFGTSDIDWTQGPDDKAAPAYFNGARLTLKGSCRLW